MSFGLIPLDMLVDGLTRIKPLPAKFIYPWAVNGLGSSNADVIA